MSSSGADLMAAYSGDRAGTLYLSDGGGMIFNSDAGNTIFGVPQAAITTQSNLAGRYVGYFYRYSADSISDRIKPVKAVINSAGTSGWFDALTDPSDGSVDSSYNYASFTIDAIDNPANGILKATLTRNSNSGNIACVVHVTQTPENVLLCSGQFDDTNSEPSNLILVEQPNLDPIACDSGSLDSGTCTISGDAVLTTGDTITAANLTISGAGTSLSSLGSINLNVTGTLTIGAGASIDGDISSLSATTVSIAGDINGNVEDLNATTVTIDSGGSINANGKGFAGGAAGSDGSGTSVGKGSATAAGSGGCHGGLGGLGEPVSWTIMDDGDSGQSFSGSWTRYTGYGDGYQDDHYYITSGSGSNTATWSFESLTSGYYKVAVSWNENSNRATDAPYTIKDGSTVRYSLDVNQENEPSANYVLGIQNFEIFGRAHLVTSGTLNVVLTDDANGYVLADAVRTGLVAGLCGATYGSESNPILKGSGGGGGDSTAGGAGGGVIKITTTGTLTINGTLSASGLVGADGDDTVDNDGAGGGAGGSIWIIADTLAGTGTLTADGGDGGSDGSENVCGGGGGGGRIVTDISSVITLANTPTASAGANGDYRADGTDGSSYPSYDWTSIRVIDDGDTGYSTEGSWTNYSGGYASDHKYAASGDGSLKAIYTFSNVVPGNYKVAATWVTNSPISSSQCNSSIKQNFIRRSPVKTFHWSIV